MKKILLCAVASTAMFTLASCVSEDINPAQQKAAGEYGYINLNVTNDDALTTRAIFSTNPGTGETTLNASDWNVVVTGTTPFNGTFAGLTGQTFAAASGYTVRASNYESLAEALSQTSETAFGAPYYTGTSAEFEVTAGGTATPQVACGKAQNAKLAITLGTLTGITINSITVTGDDGSTETTANQEDRVITFHDGTNNYTSKVAYFKADDELTYNVTYTTNGTQHEFHGNLTLSAHTSNTLSIASTDTGLISLTITYDDTFDNGTTVTYTIDAATGSATSTTTEP